MRKAWGVIAVAAILVVSAGPALALPSPSPAPTAAPAPGAPNVGAAAAILVNAQTGKVVFQRNARLRLPIASTTKIITALVARDRYSLDEMVTVTDAVNTISGQKLGLKPGMQMSVRNLLYGMLLLSGNDAATALAAHDPLGIPDFIAAMNGKAQSLGAVDSTFTNPHGLDNDGHMSTAWDMAILTRKLLADGTLAQIVSTPSYALPWPDGTSRVIKNHNKLLARYPGTIGVKTGFTNDAGNCLVAAAALREGTAITVVLKSPDHYGETTALFDWFKTHAAVSGAPSLSTPRPAPRPVVAEREQVQMSSVAVGPGRFRWVLFPMLLLAAAMVLTIRPPRRMHPLADAAAFHAFLEPLASEPVAALIEPPNFSQLVTADD